MKRIFLAIFLATLMVGCGTKTPSPQKDADYWLQEGERAYEAGLYDEAIEAWEKVRETFYSAEVNTLAERRIAETHFVAKHYPEAAAAHEDFIRQHPNHEQMPQLLFRLGLSYYRQILSPDRDQTATRSALVTFENLLRLYPDHPQAAEVASLIRQCRDRLAEHEKIVGRFYLRTGHPEAAIGRLAGILQAYPDYTDLDEAYYYLIRAYLEDDQPAEAHDAFEALATAFPTSEYVSKARKLLLGPS